MSFSPCAMSCVLGFSVKFCEPYQLLSLFIIAQNRSTWFVCYDVRTDFWDFFRLCPPFPVRYAPHPITEHVPLHGKLLCKNMARAFGGCK